MGFNSGLKGLREYKQGFIPDSRLNEIRVEISGSVGITWWRS
jgi:hypothetical protein